jgi:hypothetical protein
MNTRFSRQSSLRHRALLIIAVLIAIQLVLAVPIFAQDGTGDTPDNTALFNRQTLFGLSALSGITLAAGNIIARVFNLGDKWRGIIALITALAMSLVHGFAVAPDPEILIRIALVIANTFVIFTSAYGLNEIIAPRGGNAGKLIARWGGDGSNVA